MKEVMKFVPLDLIGNKSIDDVVDIGDRRNNVGQNMSLGVIVADSSTGGGGAFVPGGNIWKTGIVKNFGALAHNN